MKDSSERSSTTGSSLKGLQFVGTIPTDDDDDDDSDTDFELLEVIRESQYNGTNTTSIKDSVFEASWGQKRKLQHYPIQKERQQQEQEQERGRVGVDDTIVPTNNNRLGIDRIPKLQSSIEWNSAITTSRYSQKKKYLNLHSFTNEEEVKEEIGIVDDDNDDDDEEVVVFENDDETVSTPTTYNDTIVNRTMSGSVQSYSGTSIQSDLLMTSRYHQQQHEQHNQTSAIPARTTNTTTTNTSTTGSASGLTITYTTPKENLSSSISSSKQKKKERTDDTTTTPTKRSARSRLRCIICFTMLFCVAIVTAIIVTVTVVLKNNNNNDRQRSQISLPTNNNNNNNTNNSNPSPLISPSSSSSSNIPSLSLPTLIPRPIGTDSVPFTNNLPTPSSPVTKRTTSSPKSIIIPPSFTTKTTRQPTTGKRRRTIQPTSIAAVPTTTLPIQSNNNPVIAITTVLPVNNRRPNTTVVGTPVSQRPIIINSPAAIASPPRSRRPVTVQSPLGVVVPWIARPIPNLQLIGSQSNSILGKVFSSNSDGTIIAVTENVQEQLNDITVVHIYKVTAITNSWLEIGTTGISFVRDAVQSLAISNTGLVIAIGLITNAVVYRFNSTINEWVYVGNPVTDTIIRNRRRRRRTTTTIESTSTFTTRKSSGGEINSTSRQLQLSNSLGFSVSISSDGNTVAVGLISTINVNITDGRQLHVQVATYNPTIGAWSNFNRIVARQGTFVYVDLSMSSNGQLLAISHRSILRNSNVGQSIVEVYEYKRSTDQTNPSSSSSSSKLIWTRLGTIPSFGNATNVKATVQYANDTTGRHRLGIGGNGNTIMTAQVFQFNTLTNTWSLVGNNVRSLGFGTDVSISATGNRIAVQKLDQVTIFDYNNTVDTTNQSFNWYRVGDINSTTLNLPNNGINELQSWRCHLSSDGTKLLISIPYYSTIDTPNVGTIIVLET